jgi:hypothetical protein
MGKKDCYIFDIDGTLADCTERRKIASAWPKFNFDVFNNPKLVAKDKENKNVAMLCRYLAHSKKSKIILVSGRREELREVTEQWLCQKGLFLYEKLFMRKAKDYRPDTIIKMEIYKEHIEPFYNVVLAVDDRDRLVKMWRDLNIECWQVANGDF